MSHKPSAAHGGLNPSPTPFAELNALLVDLVGGLRELLGDNLVGAYLQGSFALGDFDQASDVDFIVVTRRDLTEAELPALTAMHAALFDRPGRWTKHLEGSYAPQTVIRRLSLEPRDPPDAPPRRADWADPGTGGRPPRCYPLLFLGNTSRALVRSEHDNSQVVRWILREKGVRLVGPSPRSLIDPVTPASLRAEVGEVMAFIAGAAAADPDQLRVQWLQRFYALIMARMLQSLETGTVQSKRAAATWAAQALPPRWRGLVEDAWTGRADLPRGDAAVSGQAPAAADPVAIAETLAFIDFALERAADGR
jgi:hypothetical protein